MNTEVIDRRIGSIIVSDSCKPEDLARLGKMFGFRVVLFGGSSQTAYCVPSWEHAGEVQSANDGVQLYDALRVDEDDVTTPVLLRDLDMLVSTSEISSQMLTPVINRYLLEPK